MAEDQTEEDYVLQYLSAIDRSVPMDIAFQVCDQFLFERGRGYGGTEIFALTFQPKLLVPLHLRNRYDHLPARAQQLKERGFRNRFWVVKTRAIRSPVRIYLPRTLSQNPRRRFIRPRLRVTSRK